MLSNNFEKLTPMVTKTTEVVGISPLTANAAQDTNNLGLGDTPPVGSSAAGTTPVADHLESKNLDSSFKDVAVHVAVTPKKTVLPEDYDSETGCTPHDDWRILNHRVNCDRPNVPGHTSTPSKWPGPFYVDTPPSSK